MYTANVVIVIVEGASDKSLIADRKEEYFDAYNIIFKVVGSDIFSRSKKATIKDNIRKQIKNVMSVAKFNVDDIICVLHITDGCFIGNSSIVVDDSQQVSTVYYDDSISVNSKLQKKNIEGRNLPKSDNTIVMCNSSTIAIGRHKVNYQLYYFSRHLEHVVFNISNPNKTLKVSLVNNFVNTLKVDIEKWLSQFTIKLHSNDYAGKYAETWQFIRKDNNSLKRFTNVPLMFEYINNLIDE